MAADKEKVLKSPQADFFWTEKCPHFSSKISTFYIQFNITKHCKKLFKWFCGVKLPMSDISWYISYYSYFALLVTFSMSMWLQYKVCTNVECASMGNIVKNTQLRLEAIVYPGAGSLVLDFCTGTFVLYMELLYADDLLIIADSLEKCIARLKACKRKAAESI